MFCIIDTGLFPHLQQPQTGQQPPTQPTAQPVATAAPPAPKEQETTADQNADDDIFAKFEESPPPASNQVNIVFVAINTWHMHICIHTFPHLHTYTHGH